jgi:hypothetical protein
MQRPTSSSSINPCATSSRTIFWLGYTPESATKNVFLQEIIRNEHEWSEPRQQAMAALGMSRMAGNLAVLENLYETMTSRELKRGALAGIARNDNRDAAATYLIRIAENEKDIELRKSAIANLGRVAGEKSRTGLVSTLDSSPEFELQKQAVALLGAAEGRVHSYPDPHGSQSSQNRVTQTCDPDPGTYRRRARGSIFQRTTRKVTSAATSQRTNTGGKYEWINLENRRPFNVTAGCQLSARRSV